MLNRLWMKACFYLQLLILQQLHHQCSHIIHCFLVTHEGEQVVKNHNLEVCEHRVASVPGATASNLQHMIANPSYINNRLICCTRVTDHALTEYTIWVCCNGALLCWKTTTFWKHITFCLLIFWGVIILQIHSWGQISDFWATVHIFCLFVNHQKFETLVIATGLWALQNTSDLYTL